MEYKHVRDSLASKKNILAFVYEVVALTKHPTNSDYFHGGVGGWFRDESEWWIFPAGLVLCKFLQSRLINWHVANLEIQDRSLYSNDFEMFWRS